MCTEVCPWPPFLFLFRYSLTVLNSLRSQASFEFVIHDGYDSGWDYRLAATRSSFNTVCVCVEGGKWKKRREEKL